MQFVIIVMIIAVMLFEFLVFLELAAATGCICARDAGTCSERNCSQSRGYRAGSGTCGPSIG